jgi:hypothetical protein
MPFTPTTPSFETIIVTPHAVMRYRQRVEDCSISTDEEITAFLTAAVKYGRVVHTKIGHKGNPQYVFKYQGIEVLAAKEGNGKAVVVTCYGDSQYARWYRRQRYCVRRAFCA